MAKRRKKTSHRRRRRIGALSLNASSPLVKYGSLAAGYLMADKINEQLAKVTGTIDPKIVNGVLAAGGIYLLFMRKGGSTIVNALAGLAAGVGAKGLLQEFGVISGFREMPVVSGFNDVPTIGAGYNVPATSLNGIGSYVPASGGVVGAVPDYAEGSGINSDGR